MVGRVFTTPLKAPFSAPCQDRPMEGTGRRRFAALDGLRGVAALAVVLWHVHLHGPVEVKPLAGHAYLAVDLFFMISGFILAHAYGGGLERGQGLGRFLRARLTRLYPLYALGAALGFIAFLIARSAEAQGIGAFGFAIFSLLASAFLPWVLGGAAGVDAFPLNPPSWSLSLELWGNLAYGALAPRLGPRVLVCIIALSAAVLVETAVLGHGLNYGWRQGDVWLGWPRFVFAFSVGLGMHRLWSSGRLKLPPVADWMLAAVLALVLILPDAGALNGLYDLTMVLLVFPLLAALATGARTSTLCGGPLALGARLSYPLYAVHWAVVALVAMAAERLHASPELAPVTAMLALLASVLVAWAAERWFDRPIRAWIGCGRMLVTAAVQPAG